jgi:hypothetical protein
LQFFLGIGRNQKEIKKSVFNFQSKKLLQENLGSADLFYNKVKQEKN